MSDDLAERRAPEPYEHLIASPVFSANWGRGWLGYYIVGDTSQFWFVYDDGGAVEIDYDDILLYDDKRNGLLWMIFESESFLPFVLDPPDGAVVFNIPRQVRLLMES